MSKKDKKTLDFLERMWIDLGGPKWTRLRSLLMEGLAGRFPAQTVRLVAAFVAPRTTCREVGEYRACFDQSQMIRRR